ncbi:hypothetical protein [Inediibacterium massiliense]|uniref:hypothetical protein n=1 Tax=Inediibacterium massiliense TaxID=1658111 RepID=UPI0006B5ABD9|nr:hypothetical protein [Inediibacterium massiliense]
MSAIVVFHFISTVTKDSLTSYMMSIILIVQSNILYFGGEYLKHIIIGTYYAYQQYIYGLIVHDIKITILNMIFQTICIYFLGLYIYKRME